MMLFGVVPANAAGTYSPAGNSYRSYHRVLVATGQDGTGTRTYVNPGYRSPYDTDSVYVHYTCATSDYHTLINGNNYPYRGWVNTKWWTGVNIQIASCVVYI